MEWQYLDFVFPIFYRSRETFINTLAYRDVIPVEQLLGDSSSGLVLGFFTLAFQIM
jgi:hypothetical protein